MAENKLDQQTIDTVKATVPVLEEHGTTITEHFYKRMFKEHPELLNVFNQTNQRKGRQPQALANAVLAAAKHIDRLEEILPSVKQIAHKHVSLNIKPEQYPIVGENLLAAIAEVLGDQATDDILEAWEKAYGVIADVFISVEKGMYDETAEKEGGWRELRTFRVEKKQPESAVITSFYLKPTDGQPLPTFEPGQYITIQADIKGEQHLHMRQYSLSDAPGKDYFRMSVKREEGQEDHPDGVVSTYLHDEVEEGDELQITAPAGDFVLDQESKRPVVLLSGGVGLTPLISMLNVLAEQKHPVTFIHAAIDGEHHAFDDHVADLAETHEHVNYHLCYERPSEDDRFNPYLKKEGYINREFLEEVVANRDADYYFCGPVPFMAAVRDILVNEWDISEDQVNFEFFGPAAELEKVTQ